MEGEQENFVDRWYDSLDEVGAAKRKVRRALQRQQEQQQQEQPMGTALRYRPDPRMRPLNIDKFLAGLNLRQKWRKMAKARQFPLEVPRHAIHTTRVLTEICEETLGRMAFLARTTARKQQPTSLEDWKALCVSLRIRCDTDHIVKWEAVDAILQNIEPLCYDQTQILRARRKAGADQDAGVEESYRQLKMCLWILYLRLEAVRAFLEWFVPVGRLTATEAVGQREMRSFPDLLVAPKTAPVLAYRQSDLLSATRALSIRWRSNLFYFPGLERYVKTLKARFIMLTTFPSSASAMDRPGMYEVVGGGVGGEKRVANLDFLRKMMSLFVPMERDMAMHRELLRRAHVLEQSRIWTDGGLRGEVRRAVTKWMIEFTGASRGDFITRRFRKSVLGALVRVGEPEAFVQKFPNFGRNPRNYISKLRPNDSRKYDQQYIMPALSDVIKKTLAPYICGGGGGDERGSFSWKGAEVQDRDTPPDHVAARRELLVHCLDQLFQETNQALFFASFLVRDLGTNNGGGGGGDDGGGRRIIDVFLQAKSDRRIVIVQTLSGFSVWNPETEKIIVAGDLPSALVEWAAEIVRTLRADRDHDPKLLEEVLFGTEAATALPYKELSRIMRALGLLRLVLKLADE